MLRKHFWSGTLAYKSTLEKQYFSVSEPKVEVISSKIDRVAAIYTSKFKWAWRAQFLGHTLKLWKSTYLLKLLKWFYYSWSKSLLVSDIKKTAMSSLFIHRDLHGLEDHQLSFSVQ